MTKVKCLIITFMLGMAIAQLSKVSAECTTSKNEKGNCTELQDCPILLTLLNQNNDQTDNKEFLKKTFCGHKNGKPKVCCPLESPLPYSCGESNVTISKILGGSKAELDAWPWMAALGYESSKYPNGAMRWLCGGTLISTRYILTAAHCMDTEKSVNVTTVRLGELDLNETVKDGASPIDVPVEQILIHPSYNKDRSINDIALLKLKISITFSDSIKPICLPLSSMRNKNLTGKFSIIIGRGKTKNVLTWNENPNTVLMQTRIPVMNTVECIKKYSSKTNFINNKMLCAGDLNGGKDSCLGDSGGPLMWREGIQYFSMGIVSRGRVECAQPNNPGIYTNVPSFVDWVVETVIKN